MTRTGRLLTATALAALAVLGLAGRASAIDARQTPEQAASSTGNQPGAPRPGVTQLNEGSGCGSAGNAAGTGATGAGTGETYAGQSGTEPCPAASGKESPKAQSDK